MNNKRPHNAEKGEFKSGEKAVECGKKGGIKSGIAKRERKLLKDALEILLERQHETEIDGELTTMSGAELLALRAFQGAANGDWKAWELVRDTAGQKPAEKVVVSEVDQAIMDEVESMMNEA